MTEDGKIRAIRYETQMTRLFPSVPFCSQERFDELQHDHKSLLIVDVREPEEREVSTIEGSKTVQEAEAILSSMKKDEQQSTNLLCFCTVGARSGAYATSLHRRPLLRGRVHNYSLLSHVWAERPLVTCAQDGRCIITRRVHTFSRRFANDLPHIYHPTMFTSPTALVRAIKYIPSFVNALLMPANASDQ